MTAPQPSQRDESKSITQRWQEWASDLKVQYASALCSGLCAFALQKSADADSIDLLTWIAYAWLRGGRTPMFFHRESCAEHPLSRAIFILASQDANRLPQAIELLQQTAAAWNVSEDALFASMLVRERAAMSEAAESLRQLDNARAAGDQHPLTASFHALTCIVGACCRQYGHILQPFELMAEQKARQIALCAVGARRA